MLIFRRINLRLWYFIILILLLFIIIIQKKPIDCKNLCPYSSKLINSTIYFDSSHIIRHYPDFVCPQNFRNLADWIYQWPDQFNEYIEKTTENGKYIAPCLPPGSIIYVRIWAINEFFYLIYPYLKNNFILITGEGDLSSPNDLQYLEQSNSKIIHWFGQNGQYDVSKSKKFTHIPIGINCFEMADAIQSIRFHDELLHSIQPIDITQKVLNKTKFNQNLVLINFDKNTDKTGLRSDIWKNICTLENKKTYPFITCIDKPIGVQIENLQKIYERNRQYPFWLSPRGNGLDCHRTWEALYLDIIPIVWNSSLNILYKNLPIVIINDYRELNEKFLYEKLYEISTKKLLRKKFYQYEKLRHVYWHRLILNKSRYKAKKYIYQRKNQCWRANYILK